MSVRLYNPNSEKFLDDLKLANTGNPFAQFRIGKGYYEQYSFDYDRPERNETDILNAVFWFEKAATQGHPEAQYLLGCCYEYGEGVQKDDRKAFHWYQESMNNGHFEAVAKIARCYHYGNGVEKSMKLAERYYWLYSSGSDSIVAAGIQSTLGKMYSKGDELPLNPKRAIICLRNASQKHGKMSTLRRYFVYYLITHEQTAEADKEVYEICEEDASKNRDWAINDLGICFAKGIGTPRDFDKAKSLFLQAAEVGDRKAMFNLACLSVREHNAVVQDEVAAWLEKSGYGDRPLTDYLLDE